MDDDVDNMLCVVVLESGAGWPPWIGEYQAVAPNSVVIAQAPEESAEAFGARALGRLQEVTSGRAKLRVAIVASSPSPSKEQLEQRYAICRTLVHAMADSPRADLVLAGDGDGSDQSRHELFALAGALCDELRGSELSVRVRFAEGRQKSGTMRSVAPLQADELDELEEAAVSQRGRSG